MPRTNWASLPFVVTCGDPLQFPPVPASSSLLADPENTSREHRAAEQMFADQDYVRKLSTAMRFESDRTLHPREDENSKGRPRQFGSHCTGVEGLAGDRH